MSADALLASSFAALPDIIRAHTGERPDHPALLEGGETLTFGRLTALMDRIAFASEHDGVRAGEAALSHSGFAGQREQTLDRAVNSGADFGQFAAPADEGLSAADRVEVGHLRLGPRPSGAAGSSREPAMFVVRDSSRWLTATYAS